jgi:hypothetical protein
MTITLLIITWSGMLTGRLIPKKHGMLGTIILGITMFPATIAATSNMLFLTGYAVFFLSYEITRDR